MVQLSRAGTGAPSVALLSIFLVSGAVGQTLNLRYGQAYSAARGIFSLPVAVAAGEGFFAREGLKVETLQPIPGGADHQITALHNDSVDVTHVATPFLIRAALAGSDAVAIVAEFNNPIYSLIASPRSRM
jgi:ABC-type nitrate/sulfonate/bicarbonate transport system substrate-binding protein